MAHAKAQPMVPLRDNWWHVVAATPVLLIMILLSILFIGIDFTLFRLMQFIFAVLYLPALIKDARYVRLLDTEWQPGKWWYGLFGLLVLLTLGVLSFIVSPYYLYKRRKYVGVP